MVMGYGCLRPSGGLALFEMYCDDGLVSADNHWSDRSAQMNGRLICKLVLLVEHGID